MAQTTRAAARPQNRAAALALTLALSACGGGHGAAQDATAQVGDGHGAGHGATATSAPAMPSATTPAATTPATTPGHNAADTAFAQGMIVHHEGAVEMAELAATRAGSPEVVDVAQDILDAQGPEIELMRRWLTAWGEPLRGPGGHAAHGDMGMMSEEEMAALERARGTDFDRLFLTGMIEHHRAAVEMARAQEAAGSDPEARAVAGRMAVEQGEEIVRMERINASL
ncbi:DUF305 domain-containing protein [Kineococcus sp. NUM-3379]